MTGFEVSSSEFVWMSWFLTKFISESGALSFNSVCSISSDRNNDQFQKNKVENLEIVPNTNEVNTNMNIKDPIVTNLNSSKNGKRIKNINCD